MGKPENNPNRVGGNRVLSPFPGEEEWTLGILEKAGLGEPKSTWDTPPRDIRERLKDGQLLFDPAKGGEFAEIFSTLSEEEQEKFWANVAEENEWEHYLAGGPEPKHWHRENKPVTMHPTNPVSPTRLSLEQALSRLERVRRTGRSWSARCPAHEDQSPSLRVAESPDWPGYPMFFCYAGCTHQQVKDKLMDMAA